MSTMNVQARRASDLHPSGCACGSPRAPGRARFGGNDRREKPGLAVSAPATRLRQLVAGDRVGGTQEMSGHDPLGGLTVTAFDGVDDGAMLHRALVALVTRLAHRHQDRLTE